MNVPGRPVSLAMLLVLLRPAPPAEAQDASERAAEILRSAGIVGGGLVVHLGCGDGTLTAALRAHPGLLVHGLDTDPARVERARAHVRSRGIYGPVSIDRFDGRHLPYIDNLVNLVVADDPGNVPTEEILRVLRPGGAALVGGRRTVKPWPADLDDWTHYLHNPSNNAVSRDLQVGPPRHLQWIAGPRYSRHHDHMSSISAMVAARGRIFYIFDHAPPHSILLPPDWRLVARDAFNGTILWTRPISQWHTTLFRLKSGPAQLTRRLVAGEDVLYVTLGLEAPVSALDAATGETRRTFEGSAGTEEILLLEGMLLAVVNDKPFHQPAEPRQFEYTWPEGPRRIAAWEAATGRALWSRPQPAVLPLTLAADAHHVVFHDGERVVCLDRRTGQERWRSEPLAARRPLPTSFAPTLVLHRDVVLFSGGGKGLGPKEFATTGNVIHGLSAEDGKVLWKVPHPPSGHRTPQDALVVGGLVWLPAIAQGKDSGEMLGLDPRTGEVRSRFLPDVETHWFHHRCYRAKATEKYILTSRTGIEFVDPAAKHWEIHHWVRGGCLYGVLPAHGMVFNPPHPCACYLEAKLYGFNALAPASPSRAVPREGSDEGRLERGPAYEGPFEEAADPADWPTYRHDALRSGSTPAPVPASLQPAWVASLGGRLSAPVAAGGRIYVARIDEHSVLALDAATGKTLWSFQAGGRVDSPPTVWKGRVLFGSADGFLYALRASDGALAWRFRAAPADRRLVAFEQVESAWPVHGSVLVAGDALYAVAGRWRFLDGGLRLLKLDPAGGRKLAEVVLDERDAEGRNLQEHLKGLNMPVAMADVLSSDGKWLYMKSQRFDLEGRPLDLETPNREASEQTGEYQHLFCPTGLLDDAWWHRSYWVYGRVWKSGAGGYYLAGRYTPAGRPLVFDEARVYGFGRDPQYYRWTTPMEYRLFASDKAPKIERAPAAGAGKEKAARRADRKGEPAPPAEAPKEGPQAPASSVASPPTARIVPAWAQDVPLLARAMALAGRVLFVAGPPDLVDEEAALKAFPDPAVQAKLSDQAAALEGKQGALLWAVSAEDGKKLAELRLEGVPVHDGLIAARGRLFLTSLDGKVTCLEGR